MSTPRLTNYLNNMISRSAASVSTAGKDYIMPLFSNFFRKGDDQSKDPDAATPDEESTVCIENEWTIVTKDDVKGYSNQTSSATFTKQDVEHLKELATREHTPKDGDHIILEVGPSKIFYRLRFHEVPRSSKLLTGLISRPKGTRNIWLKELTVDEFELYFVQTTNEHSETPIQFDKDWPTIARLGVAAQLLSDSSVTDIAISSLQTKAQEVHFNARDMFGQDIVTYIYAQTSTLGRKSRLRAEIAKLSARCPDLFKTLRGPHQFLADVLELLQIEGQQGTRLYNAIEARVLKNRDGTKPSKSTKEVVVLPDEPYDSAVMVLDGGDKVVSGKSASSLKPGGGRGRDSENWREAKLYATANMETGSGGYCDPPVVVRSKKSQASTTSPNTNKTSSPLSTTSPADISCPGMDVSSLKAALNTLPPATTPKESFPRFIHFPQLQSAHPPLSPLPPLPTTLSSPYSTPSTPSHYSTLHFNQTFGKRDPPPPFTPHPLRGTGTNTTSWGKSVLRSGKLTPGSPSILPKTFWEKKGNGKEDKAQVEVAEEEEEKEGGVSVDVDFGTDGAMDGGGLRVREFPVRQPSTPVGKEVLEKEGGLNFRREG